MPQTKKKYKKHRTMEEDIWEFPIYLLTKKGKLTEVVLRDGLYSYNHSKMHLHHYIKKQNYERNEEWYKKNGIQQKLILMPVPTHEQLHHIGIEDLSDWEFLYKYGIEREKLIFNIRKWREAA